MTGCLCEASCAAPLQRTYLTRVFGRQGRSSAIGTPDMEAAQLDNGAPKHAPVPPSCLPCFLRMCFRGLRRSGKCTMGARMPSNIVGVCLPSPTDTIPSSCWACGHHAGRSRRPTSHDSPHSSKVASQSGVVREHRRPQRPRCAQPSDCAFLRPWDPWDQQLWIIEAENLGGAMASRQQERVGSASTRNDPQWTQWRVAEGRRDPFPRNSHGRGSSPLTLVKARRPSCLGVLPRGNGSREKHVRGMPKMLGTISVRALGEHRCWRPCLCLQQHSPRKISHNPEHRMFNRESA